MAPFDPATGVFVRKLPPPECEYTAPGSETEAIDCWAPAGRRHVGKDGVTTGVFCAEHSPLVPAVDVEEIDLSVFDLSAYELPQEG